MGEFGTQRLRAWTARAWRRLLAGSGPTVRRLLRLARRAIVEFRDDHCLQLAGSIAFHVLLSIFPLLIVVVSVFGLLVDGSTARRAVLDTVTTYVPLSAGGEHTVLRLLAELQGGSSAIGLFGLLGLVLSAGGMMGSLRRALTLAWDAAEGRPFLRGKVLDLVLVCGAGIVLGASFGLTIAVRVLRSTEWLSWLGPLLRVAGSLVGFVLPLLLAFALFAFLFSFVPAVPTRFAQVWPGALVGATLFQLLKELFAVYLANFAHYNAVYGSLGVLAAFVFFVYLSANALLLGAEVAAEYPRVLPRRG